MGTSHKDHYRKQTPGAPSLAPLLLLVAYCCTACAVFRFRHPWLTETELILALPQALTWQLLEEPKR